MIYLIGSIILTSYLTLSFKVLQRLNIPVFPSVVVNYWVCVITGSLFQGGLPDYAEGIASGWITWALVLGVMFISLFNLIAWITQNIGVAVASVANKMSLVVPFIFSLYLYNEKVSGLNVAGIILALVAVMATCWPKKGEEGAKKIGITAILFLPALLFIGSGLLDTIIKYAEHTYLNEGNKNDFLISSFSVAALAGILLVGIQALRGKGGIGWRSVIAGICIGVPNYFSIWCLVRVLKDYEGRSAAIIPINNMGIVLFSALVAWVLFRERLSIINWAGIFLAVGAIALIAFG